MANQTIYSNTTNILSWEPPNTVDKAETENETTLVTNSSGMTVYWTQNGSSGSLADTGTMSCVQGPNNKKWIYSEASGGTVRITLTVSGGGTGSPQPKQGGGQGQGD